MEKKKKRWAKMGTKKNAPIFFFKENGQLKKKRGAKNGPSNRKRWDLKKKVK